MATPRNSTGTERAQTLRPPGASSRRGATYGISSRNIAFNQTTPIESRHAGVATAGVYARTVTTASSAATPRTSPNTAPSRRSTGLSKVRLTSADTARAIKPQTISTTMNAHANDATTFKGEPTAPTGRWGASQGPSQRPANHAATQP